MSCFGLLQITTTRHLEAAAQREIKQVETSEQWAMLYTTAATDMHEDNFLIP